TRGPRTRVCRRGAGRARAAARGTALDGRHRAIDARDLLAGCESRPRLLPVAGALSRAAAPGSEPRVQAGPVGGGSRARPRARRLRSGRPSDLRPVAAEHPPRTTREALAVHVARRAVLREPVERMSAVGELHSIRTVHRAELRRIEAGA